MDKKYLLVAGLVLVLILGVIFPRPVEKVIERVVEKMGASPGPDVYNHTFFHNGATFGGRVATTVNQTTYTTEEKDFANCQSYWSLIPGRSSLTLTFNATSTHACVPNVGDVAKVYLRNATGTANVNITLAAQNASVDLQAAASSTDQAGTLTINTNDWGVLTFIREATYLTTILFNEFIEAD